MSPVSWVGKIPKRSGTIPPCQEAGSPVRFRLSQNSHQFWVAELRCADLTAHSLSLLRDSIQGSCWNMNIISIKLFRVCYLFNRLWARTTMTCMPFGLPKESPGKALCLATPKWTVNLNVSVKRYNVRLALCLKRVGYYKSIGRNSRGLLIIYVIYNRY